MKMIPVSLALLTMISSVCAADTPTPENLVAAAKQASGGAAWDKIVTWHEVGRIEAGGLKGTYDSWFDLSTLHNVISYQLGVTSGSAGWDGAQPWTTDSSKMVRVEKSQEVVAEVTKEAYRNTYGFYFPQRYPAKLSYVGDRRAGGKTYPAIRVDPKGGNPFEVWFDAKTHLIYREVELIGPQPHSYSFSDYASFGGILVPKKQVDSVNGNSKFDNVSLVDSITFGGTEAVARYAPPPPPVDTATWPSGKTSITLPFQLINNHIYVQASINGQPVAPFMFDTGAINIIGAEFAKKVGVASLGSLPGGGFGDNVPAFGMAKIKSVSLGGITLPDQVFTTITTHSLEAVEGMSSGGLLGYEFAKRAILTIDYADKTMTFTQPRSFQPPTGVQPVAFTFAGHTPMLPATLDGVSGEYELDTGSRGPVTLMGPFAQANGLIAKDHANITGTVGYGVGGPSNALIGRAGKLVIGSATVDAPVVEISVNKHGGGSETHTAGNIGGDILKRFTVTLDYGKQLAWFQPNTANAQPEVFDRSGLWIMRASDGGLAIGSITTQSPAAKLGLTSQDEILSVNGKPAKDVVLYDLREQFKSAPGTKFDLAVKSPSGMKKLTLVLADQV